MWEYFYIFFLSVTHKQHIESFLARVWFSTSCFFSLFFLSRDNRQFKEKKRCRREQPMNILRWVTFHLSCPSETWKTNGSNLAWITARRPSCVPKCRNPRQMPWKSNRNPLTFILLGHWSWRSCAFFLLHLAGRWFEPLDYDEWSNEEN